MDTARPRWDIFCKVVDNFGDAGVCWRLARLLCMEHGLRVRLWIDHLPTLQALCPAVDPALGVQHVDGMDIRHWHGTAVPAVAEAGVVIEAFGCGLPEAYIEQMAACTRSPVWIVLEYLSAESWVDSHHGLASPHPRLPLQRYFFFPGFTSDTGGLLREADLIERREQFNAAQRLAFWREAGFDLPAGLTVSLFAYTDAPVGDWLAVLAEGSEPVVVAVPAGAAWLAARSFFETREELAAGRWCRGRLEVRQLPFLPQTRYDELLWACDLNMVRGEDSLVRAQWAARPLIWQPYRQDAEAHRRKLDAFLDRYGCGLATDARAALETFWRCWNGFEACALAQAWQDLRAAEPELFCHARRWARNLADLPEMAAQLVEFVRNKVE